MRAKPLMVRVGGVGYPKTGVIPDKRHALGRALVKGTPPPLSRICQNSLDHLLVGRTHTRRDPTRPAPSAAQAFEAAARRCEIPV